MRKRYSQQEKLKVLSLAEKVGVKEAALLKGVHVATVYAWRRKVQKQDVVKEAQGDLVLDIVSLRRPVKGQKEEFELFQDLFNIIMRRWNG